MHLFSFVRLHCFICVFFLFLFAPYSLFSFGKDDIGTLKIHLNQPHLRDGVLITNSGGVITGNNLYINAKNFVYTKKKINEIQVHTIDVEEDIYLIYKNKAYKAYKAHIDLSTNSAVLWDGCTKNSQWYIGGKEIEIDSNGVVFIHSSYMSTSENERDDWSIKASKLIMKPNDIIEGTNVRFEFESFPLFWLPFYKKSLLDGNRTPFHYRIRHEGFFGTIFEFRYDFPSTSSWKNQGMINYSFQHGVGVGLVTQYKPKESNTHFQANSFIAPPQKTKRIQYRFQGLYENYYKEHNIHLRASYDTLHNLKTKKLFPSRSIHHTRPGTAQIELWRKEESWIARMESRARIDSFTTVREELPLCSFHQRPYLIANSSWFLENRISTGFLQYKYAHKFHSSNNFASTRSEISQKIFKTFTLSPLIITPSVGYRALHYSSSPKGGQKVQLLGEASCMTATRFIRSIDENFESIEPYYNIQSIIKPSLNPKKTYIFGLDDGFVHHIENRVGVRHSLLLSPNSPTLFQKKVYTDVYTRSYFGTKYLSSYPKKIWIETTFDPTAKSSYKMQFGYDFHRKIIDHWNLESRYTLSSKAALTFEYRFRSPYHWRKIDRENYNLEALYSEKKLRKTKVSDKRNSFITSLFLSPSMDLDIELKSIFGFRPRSLRYYHDFELSLFTLIRGALQVKCSYGIRSGKEHRWTLSLNLGGKRSSSSTGFHKIGQGNYDIH